MGESTLVTLPIDAGRRLIDELSADGVPVELAGWAYYDNGRSPSLFVVSSQVATTGSGPIYEVINRIQQVLSAQGHETVDWLNIRVLKPNQWGLTRFSGVSSRIRPPGMWLTDGDRTGGVVDPVFVYSLPVPAPTPA